MTYENTERETICQKQVSDIEFVLFQFSLVGGTP